MRVVWRTAYRAVARLDRRGRPRQGGGGGPGGLAPCSGGHGSPLEGGGRTEADGAGRGNVDGLAGSRISADTGRPLLALEGPETGDGHGPVTIESVNDRIDDRLDRLLGILPRTTDFGRDAFDQITLVHHPLREVL